MPAWVAKQKIQKQHRTHFLQIQLILIKLVWKDGDRKQQLRSQNRTESAAALAVGGRLCVWTPVGLILELQKDCPGCSFARPSHPWGKEP